MAEVYDRYSAIVYSVALRVLGDTGAAEDVMQEIFLRLWRTPELFDSNRGSLGAWLAVITRHRSIDQLRKRRPETGLEDVVVSVEAHLEREVDRHRFLDRVRAVLRALPDEQQRAMEMAFFEGLTHSEIATRTGEPLGTIKTRIRSALIALRKGLADTVTA
ncbi:MAG: sigma-70 family RNA polymerase sigma factor [Acidobacteriales bacterium]|nr:sigma-70 family RNA polymerase sigma factor [Terriglobales bacterium]